MVRWVALIACGACGRFGFDARLDASGSGSGDARITDAPADAAPCANPGPWMQPQPLAINTMFNDWSPALSGDGQRLVFQSNRSGNNALWESAAPFSTATIIAALDTAGSERAPTLSADGLVIYYTSNSSGTDQPYRAVRPSLGAPFGTPQLVTVTGAASVIGPALGADGELFYNDTAETTVYRAVGSGTAFTQDRALTELGTAAYAAISRDGMTIYFTANSASSPVIYAATRPSIGAAFGTPAPVANIGVGTTEEDPELGKDDRTLVFAATSASNGAELYLATRVCN